MPVELDLLYYNWHATLLTHGMRPQEATGARLTLGCLYIYDLYLSVVCITWI